MIVPDGTRSCPLPLLVSGIHNVLHGRVRRLTVLVALGTHAAMSEEALAAHLGYPAGALADRYPSTTVLNHAWWDPSTFAQVGIIGADRIAELSDGMLNHTAHVRVNRAVVEHDVTIIVSPVFPHEVVGFSGGNKYLFPGISGRELIDLSHWLGALITSAKIIGTRGITPVRALIDEAASMVPGERFVLGMVTKSAHPRPACDDVRRPVRGVGGRGGCIGRNAHPLPRRAGTSGPVADPDQVRRHVDRRQRFLQGRADRRRRRPGRAVRPAYPGNQQRPIRRSSRLVTTAVTTS